MKPSNDALRGLLHKIHSYEPFIYNTIMISIFYPMKDSDELREAVKLWLGDESKAISKYGRKAGAFFKRISRAIPVWGVASIIYRFPWKRYFYLFPIYAVVAIPLIHIVNILGFWKGFFFPDKESDRNKVD